MRVSCDESADFSKYFHAEDKSSLYNYSSSHNNETLLLETTDIHQRPHPLPTHPPNSNSLLEDLYQQLEVTLSQSRAGEGEGTDLGETCRQLVGALRKLENKVERMEQQERGRHQKESRATDCQRDVESVHSFSTKGSKCRCEDRTIGGLLEYVEQRSKVDLYRQEKEALQRQVVRLEVANEDLRKQLRKLQSENLKVKDLLKQYRQLGHQQTLQEYYEETCMQDNIRPAHTHTRCNTLQEISPETHPCRRTDKENIKQLFEWKLREEELRGFSKQPPMTPNPLLRTTKSQQMQATDSKDNCARQTDRRTQLNQRVERLLDTDNMKTESKSRERRAFPLKAFSRGSPRPYRQEFLLEQGDYQIEGKPLLEHADTMTTLPDCSPPSFFDLRRIQSSRSLLCSPERLSPLRSLPKQARR